MNDLLTPTFGENFEVILNYPLWITSDPYKAKKESKRVLLEMVDTYDKLSLAYSGGTDSGFLLCCIHDLIEEGKLKKDTIEIFHGIFIADGRTQVDSDRAIRFANSLGFDPKKVVIDLDNRPDIHDVVVNQTFKNIEKFGGLVAYHHQVYACALQDYLYSLQDSTVIVANWSTYWGGREPQPFKRFPEGPVLLVHVKGLANVNEVEMFLWDNKIASSFISPYQLKKSPIDTEPILKLFNISKIPSGPLNPQRFNSDMGKWIIYLQCYPKMAMLLYKFNTIPYNFRGVSVAGDRREEFKKLIKPYKVIKTKIKLPTGEYFTQKHLTNYKDYFME